MSYVQFVSYETQAMKEIFILVLKMETMPPMFFGIVR